MKHAFYILTIVGLAALNFMVYSCNQQAESNTDTSTQSTTTEETSLLASDEIAIEDTSAMAANDMDETAKTEENSDEEATEKKTTETVVKKEKPATKTSATKAKKPKTASVPTPKAKKAPPKPAKPRANANFKTKEHDFGFVNMGTKVEHNFSFTNTGKVPLIIQDANSSCGCTIPEIPRQPIAPGDQSSIRVVFDTMGKPGVQRKTVKVKSNAGSFTLAMKGVVTTDGPPPEEKEKVVPTPAPPTAPTPTETKTEGSAPTEDGASITPMSDTKTEKDGEKAKGFLKRIKGNQ